MIFLQLVVVFIITNINLIWLTPFYGKKISNKGKHKPVRYVNDLYIIWINHKWIILMRYMDER